ncbi:hypothetical protein VCR20J5_1240391 [Vibrio crassostreae]|nr:hypothetical protein VCR20J5_1240391 [Vibrio crassostreae]
MHNRDWQNQFDEAKETHGKRSHCGIEGHEQHVQGHTKIIKHKTRLY